MRHFFIVALLIFCIQSPGWSAAPEQNPLQVQGQVLVKLKPAFAYLNADGKSMRTAAWQQMAPSLSVYKTISFSSFDIRSTKRANARTAAPDPATDLRLYHQLSFDPAIPVNQAIDELLKSGMVELAEPVHLEVPYLLPNDPQLAQQYYLELVNAYKAWELSQGSEEVIIAIVDSGVDVDHPDLAANIYKNEADPIDGIDNDGDGYVDNYWGWDFAGDDFANTVEDHDPRVKGNNAAHGTLVAGCAAAVPDNGIGIAGIGYHSKLMALKHTADNDARFNGVGYLSNVLQGVLYAATHGAHIINASYGSQYYSQIANDLYRYVALEYGVLVVGAAGNSNSTAGNYPSDYDYVLSVAASTAADKKASFSNYSTSVDLSAPGSAVLSTRFGGTYGAVNGTSFSAPLVAGAAALLKAKYPRFTGIQLGELLRVTANSAFLSNLDSVHRYSMGRGRLDISQALQQQSPALRAERIVIETAGGDLPAAGQQAVLYADIRNALWPATGTTLSVGSLSEWVTVEEATLALGTIGEQQVISIKNKAFRLNIHPQTPANTELLLRLDFRASGYEDHQFVKVLVNPSYYNLSKNRVSTTIAGTGRLGYEDAKRARGLGFVFEEANLLYEMGLLMGTSPEHMLSSVRAATGINNDYAELLRLTKKEPGPIADLEVSGRFDDQGAGPSRRLGIEVAYKTYVWQQEPYERTVFLEYKVYNISNADLNGFHIGFFADWDINPENAKDLADWDEATQTGYVYSALEEERKVAGIQLLNGPANYWAIDNGAAASAHDFGVYDGYTDEEKYRSLSGGIAKKIAGKPKEGSDVSHVVGAGPYALAAGDSLTVTFAVHAGSQVEEVLLAAQKATELYERTQGLRKPLGVLANDLPGLELYPNPSRGSITLRWPELPLQKSQIRVLDAAGRLVSLHPAAAGAKTLTLELPPQKGLYLLEIVQGDLRTFRRVVKQ